MRQRLSLLLGRDGVESRLDEVFTHFPSTPRILTGSKARVLQGSQSNCVGAGMKLALRLLWAG